MTKVRFLCTKHECDLGYDSSNNLLTPETLSDNSKDIVFASKEDAYTGYFLFDLSECWCSEDEGNKVDTEKVEETITKNGDGGPYIAEDDVEYTPSQCQDFWRVVLYSD